MSTQRVHPFWLVLTDEDAHGLQQYGVLDLTYESGYQELHRDCFFRHDDISNALRGNPKPTDMLKIPLILISRRVLIWLGFSDKQADLLWPPVERFLNKNEIRSLKDGQAALSLFQNTIEYHIRRENVCDTIPALNTFTDDDNEWRQILHAYGLSQQFADMIMDPRFREHRLTEPCIYWIDDTLRQRWELLLKIRETSRRRAARIWKNHNWHIYPSSPSPILKLDLFKARQRHRDQEEDQNKDKAPDFYTMNLPWRESVRESKFLRRSGESQGLHCTCYFRKHSRTYKAQNHFILYKVVTGTQLKNIRISIPGNFESMMSWNIDSLAEGPRRPEREPFLYNDATSDGDTGNGGASVGPHRRARKMLVFSTPDRELALAEYKWAVHRLDKSVGTVDGAKFAGGADVRILEIRIPMVEIDDLVEAKLAYFNQDPIESDVGNAMWQEMGILSTLKELIRPPSRFASFETVWWENRGPDIQEARRTIKPTLRAIKEGEWIVLGCPAVKRRAVWNLSLKFVSRKLIRKAAEEGTATSGKPEETAPTPTPTTNKDLPKTSSPATSASSSFSGARLNTRQAFGMFFIYTGNPLKRVDEYVINITEDWMRKWLFERICYFESHEVVLGE